MMYFYQNIYPQKLIRRRERLKKFRKITHFSFPWKSHSNWRRDEKIYVIWKSHYSEPNMQFFPSYLRLIIRRGSFTQIPNAQSCCWFLNLKSTSRVASSPLSLVFRTSNCLLTTSQMISCYPRTIYRLISRMRNSFAVNQVALKVLIGRFAPIKPVFLINNQEVTNS